MSELRMRKGDKVRVSFEGVVAATYDYESPCWDMRVQLASGTETYVRHEHVSVIEPEYEVGAVYIDNDGDIFRRVLEYGEERWRDTIDGEIEAENYPARPLRKLVPEA